MATTRWREGVQQIQVALAGVGRVKRRVLQIRRVLDGQQVVVKFGGIGVRQDGRIFRAADGLFPKQLGRPEGRTRRGEGVVSASIQPLVLNTGRFSVVCTEARSKL